MAHFMAFLAANPQLQRMLAASTSQPPFGHGILPHQAVPVLPVGGTSGDTDNGPPASTRGELEALSDPQNHGGQRFSLQGHRLDDGQSFLQPQVLPIQPQDRQ